MGIFFIVWAVWFCSELLLNRLMRSPGHDDHHSDSGSLAMIWAVVALANAAAVLLHIYVSCPISLNSRIGHVGLAIILLGMGFRFIAIWSLGRMFTVDVAIVDDHQIKKNGLYGLLRHPSYTGSIISFIGFGISLNNWFSLTVAAVFVIAVMLYRISIEEKVLLKRFGAEYADYMKQTYRLIPWIY